MPRRATRCRSAGTPSRAAGASIRPGPREQERVVGRRAPSSAARPSRARRCSARMPLSRRPARPAVSGGPWCPSRRPAAPLPDAPRDVSTAPVEVHVRASAARTARRAGPVTIASQTSTPQSGSAAHAALRMRAASAAVGGRGSGFGRRAAARPGDGAGGDPPPPHRPLQGAAEDEVDLPDRRRAQRRAACGRQRASHSCSTVVPVVGGGRPSQWSRHRRSSA